MKQFLKRMTTALLVGLMLYPNVFALKVTPLNPEDVFSEEILEKESVSDWAASEVNAAIAAGLVPALTDRPAYQDAITREQFAELVVNFVLKCNIEIEEETISFSDCTNKNVLLAASAGIVNGTGNNRFSPTTTTNREQIATMLYRAIGYIKDESGTNLAPLNGNINSFADKNKVSSWAVEGVGSLAANGIMKGTSATMLSPQESCTVEQSILLIYRLYQSYLG